MAPLNASGSKNRRCILLCTSKNFNDITACGLVAQNFFLLSRYESVSSFCFYFVVTSRTNELPISPFACYVDSKMGPTLGLGQLLLMRYGISQLIKFSMCSVSKLIKLSFHLLQGTATLLVNVKSLFLQHISRIGTFCLDVRICNTFF